MKRFGVVFARFLPSGSGLRQRVAEIPCFSACCDGLRRLASNLREQSMRRRRRPVGRSGASTRRRTAMRIRKSLIATAVLVALGFSGQAWSQQDESGRGDNNSTYSEDNSGNKRDNLGVAVAIGLGNAAADNNSTTATNEADSFNSSKSEQGRAGKECVVTGRARG